MEVLSLSPFSGFTVGFMGLKCRRGWEWGASASSMFYLPFDQMA